MNKFGTQSVNEPVTHIESVSVKGNVERIWLATVCDFGKTNST